MERTFTNNCKLHNLNLTAFRLQLLSSDDTYQVFLVSASCRSRV
jgi:hypothetical protein